MAVSAAGAVYADTEQTVTIDGSVESKFVKELVFSGNQVTLVFEDGLSTSADMETVNIAFGYTPSAIGGISTDEKTADQNIYSIDGKLSGKDNGSLNKGVYIRNGKKFTVK